MNRILCALSVIVSLLCCASPTPAANVTWNVDSTQSFLQLSIPTQAVSLGVTPSGNAFSRNQGASSGSWTVGNQAPISGTLASDWNVGSSIQFLAGQHNLTALDSGAYAPDFANWNAGTSTFNPANATASAPFGGQLGLTQLGVLLIFVGDAARFAIRDVEYDLASAAIPLVANQFAATQTSFNMSDAQMGLRGNSGFSFPSDFGSLADVGVSIGGTNAALLGSITTPDPLQPFLRQLTLPVSIPMTLNLFDGQISTLQGSATGTIVAYALVPEPASSTLFATGVVLGLRRALRRATSRQG